MNKKHGKRPISASTPETIDIQRLIDAFHRYDPSNSASKRITVQGPGSRSGHSGPPGTITMLEFERGLLAIGVDITEVELAEVVTDLQIEHNGRVRYDGKGIVMSVETVYYDVDVCRV